MKVGDLIRWTDDPAFTSAEPLFGIIVEHLRKGWVSVYWLADDVPDNPTREPIPHLVLLNENR